MSWHGQACQRWLAHSQIEWIAQTWGHLARSLSSRFVQKLETHCIWRPIQSRRLWPELFPKGLCCAWEDRGPTIECWQMWHIHPLTSLLVSKVAPWNSSVVHALAASVHHSVCHLEQCLDNLDMPDWSANILFIDVYWYNVIWCDLHHVYSFVACVSFLNSVFQTSNSMWLSWPRCTVTLKRTMRSMSNLVDFLKDHAIDASRCQIMSHELLQISTNPWRVHGGKMWKVYESLIKSAKQPFWLQASCVPSLFSCSPLLSTTSLWR